MSAENPSRASYLAIALVSSAVILLQVAFTRVLSVVLWYHFAFLSVSLAMLGIGAPGVWFALRPPGPRALRLALLIASAVVPLSVAGIVGIGAFLPELSGTVTGLSDLAHGRVLVTVLCTLAPLLALGSAVVILLMSATGPAFGRMYAADLVGAAAGALMIVPLMHVVPTPSLVAAVGFLPLAAVFLVSRPVPRTAVALAVALAAALAWGAPFRLHYTKVYAESDVLLEQWTPTARIAVFPRPFFRRDPSSAFGWGMGSRFTPYPVEQLWIEQDGSAGTPVTRLDRPLDRLEHLLFDVTSAAYQIRRPGSVCVIGSGGGRDVLTALIAGARTVDAVELNPAIVAALRGPFREFAGDLYGRPDVRVHVSEGRSFLERSDTLYDAIQISLVDSWAATAAGAFALSENNLYTLEAMRAYLRRLAPDGLLSVSRWSHVGTQLGAPRLALLVKTALELEGESDPLNHIAVVEAGNVSNVIVSRSPWRPIDIGRLGAVCEEKGFVRHWPVGPTTPPKSFIVTVLAAGTTSLEEVGLDLSPPTDDRPFFFQMVPVFSRIDSGLAKNLSLNDTAVVLLRWLMVFVGAVAISLFLAPLVLAGRMPRGPGFWRGSVYFASIGIAFLLVEAALIQKFILYLGHPSHATTVVLAAILLGAGGGSWLATKVSGRAIDRGRFALPLAVAAVLLVLPMLFARTLGLPFGVRVGLSVAVLVPLASLMGFAFPVGIARFGEERKAWYWAINGVTGVLAGIVSLALAMTFGYSGVLWLGAGVYLAACLALPRRLPAPAAARSD